MTRSSSLTRHQRSDRVVSLRRTESTYQGYRIVTRRNGTNTITRRATSCALAGLLAASPLALSGCSLFGGLGVGGSSSATVSTSANGQTGGTSSSNANVTRTTSTAYAIKIGAKNPMVNDAVQLTVTGVERRPVSTFANAMQDASGGSSASSDDTNRVAIEVDVSYTYNSTALTTNTQQYGGNINGSVTTLSDLLLPGKLMYITGKDQNGSEYVASDVLAVNTGTQTADNTLGTNAQWDYDVLDSELPQAAQTKTGSMVFIVSSTAKDLTLHMITANKNASPTNEEAVGAGNNYHYTLDLS